MSKAWIIKQCITNTTVIDYPSLGRIRHSVANSRFKLESITSGVAIKYVAQGAERYLIEGQGIKIKRGEYLGMINKLKNTFKKGRLAGFSIERALRKTLFCPQK